MNLYPIFLDLRGRRALVIGDGDVAARKAEPLRAAGARVVVRPRFDPEDLVGCAVAVGADAPDGDLRALAEAGEACGIPVNIVDRPGWGSFISPALVDRDPITVAISSAGTAPVLARMLRQRIEAALPHSLGRLAALADSFRAELRRTVPDPARRRPLLEAALSGPAADLLAQGRDDAAHAAFAAALRGEAAGAVFLIGAGPGEPDLLTLRAHRLLGQAELIVHDANMPHSVLAMARRDAPHSVAGRGGTERLIEAARAGSRAVRLGLGDGRALYDEMVALRAAGVTAELVPGLDDAGSARVA